MQDMKAPEFREALRFWAKLGFISFGGPAGQIAIMHQYLVEKKKWISDSRFLHALNYCMLLPGPEAQQLAIYTGWLMHGLRGGRAAGILFVLPSMFILLALSLAYVTFGKIPAVYALFDGLKSAVVAIVLVALIRIGKKSLHTLLHYGIAFAAFFCIFFLQLPFPLIMIGAILLALIILKFFPVFILSSKTSEEKKATDESDYYIQKNTILPDTGFKASRFRQQILAGILLWLLPIGLFYMLSVDFAFWKRLSLFFTQAALVTFGGAYAVLPYVAQVSVEQFHWLSSLQMIDGMALGETTPGPLIMILAFVGFMASYHQYGNSLLMSSLGLFTTTYYTFLPSFLYIFIGAPLIERTQGNEKVKAVLGLVSAAVVGVILNLTIYFVLAVLFTKGRSLDNLDYFSLGWMLLSFAALYRFNVNMILWIGISALVGLAKYFLV